MDIYHIWCNLKPSSDALEFVSDVESYLRHLREHEGLANFRITRRKLGFGPAGLGEFHITLEFPGLAELDKTFALVARRADPVEALHRAVYSRVCDLNFALYRDFPGNERNPRAKTGA